MINTQIKELKEEIKSIVDQWDLNPEAKNKVDTNFTIVKVKIRDWTSSKTKTTEERVMD